VFSVLDPNWEFCSLFCDITASQFSPQENSEDAEEREQKLQAKDGEHLCNEPLPDCLVPERRSEWVLLLLLKLVRCVSWLEAWRLSDVGL
jgi:hypothetical protein